MNQVCTQHKLNCELDKHRLSLMPKSHLIESANYYPTVGILFPLF